MTDPSIASVEPARARAVMPGPDERFRRSVIAASTWEQRHGYARPGTKDAAEAQIVRLRRTLRAARAGRSGLPWSPAHQALVDTSWPSAWKDPSPAARYEHRDAVARQRTAEAAEATAAAAAAAKAARAAARKAPRPAPAGTGGGYMSAARAARDDETFRARVQRAAAWESQHGRPVARTVEDGGIEHFNFRSRLRAAAAGTGRMVLTPDRIAYLDEHWPSWRPTSSGPARPAASRSKLDRFTDRVRTAASWEAEHGRRAKFGSGDRVEQAVAQLGTDIRSAIKNGSSARFSWNGDRRQVVHDLWPDALEQRVGSVVRRDEPLRDRIAAAAAWEARNGEAREDGESADERGVATLRARLVRASRGLVPSDRSRKIEWTEELAAFVSEHWPSALRDGREASGEDAFRARVLAAAAWEAEHGRAATNSDTDSYERSVHFLRRRIRDARAGRVNGQLAWTAERDAFVAEHWDMPANQSSAAAAAGRPADEKVFQDRVKAAAAWEAVFGRSVSRTVPDARPFQMLRTAMRRAAAGHSTMAWSPEREAFADEHWPSWRA